MALSLVKGELIALSQEGWIESGNCSVNQHTGVRVRIIHIITGDALNALEIRVVLFAIQNTPVIDGSSVACFAS